MVYSVKEMFLTLQGEGAHAGRPAVFCRFSGCNLWTGREEDRLSAECRFCDTDFIGQNGQNGGKFKSAEDLAQALKRFWPMGQSFAYVVFTGGEPLLQLDAPLIDHMHALGFEVAVETNGTIAAPPHIDWICVSPKVGTVLKQKSGNELKLVYPQTGMDPQLMEELAFDHFWLQPMDGPHKNEYTQMAVQYCLARPRWRLSLQTHKLIGIE